MVSGRVLKMERGWVEDQPQRLTNPECLGNSSVLRLVEDDTGALRDFTNTLPGVRSRMRCDNDVPGIKFNARASGVVRLGETPNRVS
jgi:hypothetical protein